MKNIGATKAVASTFVILVGLAGIEHGFFEMLQGNVTPSGEVQKNPESTMRETGTPSEAGQKNSPKKLAPNTHLYLSVVDS